MSQPDSTSPKQQFLDAYEREHAITMRVLRAYPSDRLDLRPHEKARTARELAYVFVAERRLGMAVFTNQLAQLLESGAPPTPPEEWEELLSGFEAAHREYGEMVSSTPDDQLYQKVPFFTAPKTMGEISRIDLLWFLLSDEIHHRGQFSIYLRMAGGKVPSIYGPSGDEPWM
jgi:uncharacterized damage-inducible protein DinB